MPAELGSGRLDRDVERLEDQGGPGPLPRGAGRAGMCSVPMVVCLRVRALLWARRYLRALSVNLSHNSVAFGLIQSIRMGQLTVSGLS